MVSERCKEGLHIGKDMVSEPTGLVYVASIAAICVLFDFTTSHLVHGLDGDGSGFC